MVTFYDGDGLQVDEVLGVPIALVDLLHFAEFVTDEQVLLEGVARKILGGDIPSQLLIPFWFPRAEHLFTLLLLLLFMFVLFLDLLHIFALKLLISVIPIAYPTSLLLLILELLTFHAWAFLMKLALFVGSAKFFFIND